MLDSVFSIFRHYLDLASSPRSAVYSIEVERSENPVDYYYLCRLDKGWFVILETDYVIDIDQTVQEVTDIFNVKPRCWVIKRSAVALRGATIPLSTRISPDVYDALALRGHNPPFIYLVLAVEGPIGSVKRYDPTVYGFAR